jgi:hypothetical protein
MASVNIAQRIPQKSAPALQNHRTVLNTDNQALRSMVDVSSWQNVTKATMDRCQHVLLYGPNTCQHRPT